MHRGEIVQIYYMINRVILATWVYCSECKKMDNDLMNELKEEEYRVRMEEE